MSGCPAVNMACFKRLFWLWLMSPILAAAAGNDFQITSFDPNGQITWANAFTRGVCTVESSSALGDGWTPRQNFFTTNSIGTGTFAPSATNAFLRVRTVQISTNTPQAFTNLIQSYGILH